MKKKLYLAALLLTGCSTEIEPNYYEWGNKVCADNGGLEYLEAFYHPPLYPNAKCNNGAKFFAKNTDFK